MKLSIITINYNNAEGLKKTLASVAAQTYTDIEHIIVDGGSTDGSVEIIQAYASVAACSASGNVPTGGDGCCAAVDSQDSTPANGAQPSIKWISEPDNGIYNAMNKGIRMATGEYIQILNSGDILAAADVTERMVAALEEARGEDSPAILYGNMIKEWPDGRRVKDTCLGEDKSKQMDVKARLVEWTMYDFIRGTINHDPTYIRSDIYEKYGLYDDNLKIVSDWKWFVQAVVIGGEDVYYVPMDVTIFDMTGISETNLKAREDERRSELEKMFPMAILKDYDAYHFPINQIKRLKRHHLWGIVYFAERVLFKLEKWGILK